MQAEGSGSRQTPALPPEVMQRAGARHGGPLAVSQASPSAAGPRQVPGEELVLP